MTQNGKKLYLVAKTNIGEEIAQNKELGCAETVNALHLLAFGNEIGGGASTYQLWQALKSRPDFQEIPDYEAGAIIISPTGTQPAASRLAHGHVGICGYFQIMSNNSLTGVLDTQWTRSSWEQFFGGYGGFPIYYFRKL